MKCEEVQRLLVSGEASVTESAEMEAHLATCDLCRNRRRGLEVVTASLQALRSSPNSEGRLVRAAIAQFQAEQTRPRFPYFWGWGMVLGATAAASVGLTLYLMRDTGKGTTQGGTASIASVKNPNPIASATPPIASVASLATPGAKDINTPSNRLAMGPETEQQRDPSIPKRGVRSRAIPHPRPLRQPVRIVAVPTPVAPVVDDLDYLNNGTARFANRWTGLTQIEEQEAVAEILRSVKRVDDFVEVAPPLVASNRDAAITRSALAQYRHELQIVDARLQRKVALSEKGTPFSELCQKLETLTGIAFVAGRNVMDDKVTIFCKERPLRDIMREIATLFNFAWERTGEEGSFTYRLKQPLASALLEEELRNKDQNEALLALDREMEAVRNLLNLSPEEAAQRAANAEGVEKQRLEAVAGLGRAPSQLYSQLSPEDLTALRDGEQLRFSSQPNAGGRAISPEMATGILQGFPGARVLQNGGVTSEASGDDLKNGIPLTQYPGIIAEAGLWVNRSELGRFQLLGFTGFGTKNSAMTMSAPIAEGISPSSRTPKNAEANAPFREMPGMKKKVSIIAKPSCELSRFIYPATPSQPTTAQFVDTSPRITTADVLEAIHKTTGQDVIGDYYTRVYHADEATVQGVTLFDALCNIADSLRLRWSQRGGWLDFRSVSFFHDRQKEVPKRLLERWAMARKRNGYLSMTELIDIAKLSKAQLDSGLLAEGIKAIYGLNEWDVMRGNYQRHLRFLTSLPPAAQQAALSSNGMPFSHMTYAEQQNFTRLMETLPFEQEVIPSLTFKVKTITPLRKNASAASAEAQPTRDEGRLAMIFLYTWLKDDTQMGFYQSYQSSGTGGVNSIPELK